MGKIRKIQTMLMSGECSCCELTKRYLAEIGRSELGAYISVTPDAALEAAGAVDAKLADGGTLAPLEGVPLSLKDNVSTAGLETSCAAEMLRGYIPIYDAFIWELLKNQNAVLLGKANMDEFAMGSTCETSRASGTKNPHNPEYVSGGSSGGSACSVAANLAAYSIGSDTGGSVRQPASFCGSVGLKPTYGAISRRGVAALASSLDQVGIIAEDSEDVATVFAEIAKYDTLDMTSKNVKFGEAKFPMKIGVADEFFDGASPAVTSAVENAINVYKSLGCEIVPVKFPLLKYALPVYYILSCAEASSNLGRFDGIRFGPAADSYEDVDDGMSRVRSAVFGAEVKRRILLGTYVLSAGYFDAYYKKAQDLRYALTRDIKEGVLGKCDVLLTPTAPTTALKMGTGLTPIETYLTDICTVTVNITGLPALSVPCGYDANGLPVGLQLIGPEFSEYGLLNAAGAFEQATGREFVGKLKMGVAL